MLVPEPYARPPHQAGGQLGLVASGGISHHKSKRYEHFFSGQKLNRNPNWAVRGSFTAVICRNVGEGAVG